MVKGEITREIRNNFEVKTGGGNEQGAAKAALGGEIIVANACIRKDKTISVFTLKY